MDLSSQFSCAQIFGVQQEVAGFPLNLSVLIGSVWSYSIWIVRISSCTISEFGIGLYFWKLAVGAKECVKETKGEKVLFYKRI